MAKKGWDVPPETQVVGIVNVHNDLMKQAALRVLRGVVLRSPVDTGRFRANWQVSEGTASKGVVQQYSEGSEGSTKGAVTQQALGAGTVTIFSDTKKFPVYYVTNNLPYAQRLEQGWSDQASSGMVVPTLIEVKQWLDSQ